MKLNTSGHRVTVQTNNLSLRWLGNEKSKGKDYLFVHNIFPVDNKTPLGREIFQGLLLKENG